MVDESVKTLRDLTIWRFKKVKAGTLDNQTKVLVAKLTTGMSEADKQLTEGLLTRVDTKYLKGNRKLLEDNFTSIVKSMQFLGFFDDKNVLRTKDANGKARSCLDSFSDLMATRMRHTEHDRDLVVMRHNFIIEN